MKKKLVTLYTKSGENFNIENWNVYPRPQMKRDSFLCLNGEWDFAISKKPEIPEHFNRKITVPFPPQAVLSGIGHDIADKYYLIYKREFTLPEGFNKGKVFVNFGAVDQKATVFVNGINVGENKDGYTPFSFDITDALKENNTIVVIAKDDLDSHVLPYGKQKHKRGGMWYTPVSGIWQTVWLESTPQKHILGLDIECDDKTADIWALGVKKGVLTLHTPEGDEKFDIIDANVEIKIKNPLLWSPETPNIYRFTVEYGEDKVESYFAFRKIEIKGVNGVPRLCLNGKPYFFHGLLDQGYFPDGIFTPASPEEYKNDILSMKELGFNTLRKHIKVEPEIFYYYCDIYGMAVFQDFVNNGKYSFLRDTALPTLGKKKITERNSRRKNRIWHIFNKCAVNTIGAVYKHPSVMYWTIFNEGWGQRNTKNTYEYLKPFDKTRIFDTASGWFKTTATDVESEHVYFKKIELKKSDKPIILSEFGGYSYKPEGHVMNPYNTYGYRFFKEQPAFMDALYSLYNDEVIPLIEKGLCAAVYTQVSDVEDETNGLLSYDRKILKVDKDKMLEIAEKIKTVTERL